MRLPLFLQPDAGDEYNEAVDWFESRRSGDGEKFINAVQATFDRISANPRLHVVVLSGVRKAVVTGYKYYCIYYRERSSDIEILSVFHTSRDPSVWQSRI